MELTVAAGNSVALLTATVLIHFEMFRLASGLTTSQAIPHRGRILIVIAVVLLAHIVEIGLYAAAFGVCQGPLRLGFIDGTVESAVLDVIYFSMTTYTTLGVGDLHARGSLRLIAGVESLNGFVLIGWSASFTYLAMEQSWGGVRGRDLGPPLRGRGKGSTQG
jgi:ion channel